MDKWLGPKFKSLAETNAGADTQVIVGGRTFACHKLIITTASKWFQNEQNEESTKQLCVPNVKPEIFEKFRLYIYTYSVNELDKYDNETMIELLKCGHKLEVNSLVSECTRILSLRIPNMTIQDLSSAYKYALNTQNYDLLEELNKIVSKDTLGLGPISELPTADFSDCCVIIGEKTFKCHKIILASVSEYFKNMLNGEFKESISGEIHLKDVDPESFELFHIYTYTRSTEPFKEYQCEKVLQLLECAYKWLMSELITGCTNVLLERIPKMKIDDLVNVFQYSHTFHNKQLIESLNKVLTTKSSLYCDEATELTYDAFLEYVKLPTSEMARFQLVEAYIKANRTVENVDEEASSESEKTENIKKADQVNGITDIKYMHLLEQIGFHKMSFTEFFDGPGKSDVLSAYDKFELIGKIHRTCMCGTKL